MNDFIRVKHQTGTIILNIDDILAIERNQPDLIIMHLRHLQSAGMNFIIIDKINQPELMTQLTLVGIPLP